MTITKFEVPDWIRSVLICDPTDIWGNVVGMGLAELVARLTGMGGYDRRGNALFFDTFEGGLSKGVGTSSGTLSDVQVSSSSVRGEGLSLCLTAGSDANKVAAFYYYLPYPILGRCGLEIAFTVQANTAYVGANLALSDGTNLHEASIRYDKANNKVQYTDASGAWQDLITGVVLSVNDKAFHTLKMVVDLSADHYHRVLVDGWSWTVGSLDCWVHTFGIPKQFYAFIDHYGAGGSNPVCYVDSVIFTQNEPA